MQNRYTSRTFLLEVLLVAVAVVWAIPLIALVNVSLKPVNTQTNALEFVWPPSVDNYAQAWLEASLGAALLNSAVVTVISVAAIVVISALASYPLARATRRWSRWTFYFFLAGLLLPSQLALLPLYSTMRDIGVLGSLVPVILINVGTAMPFSIFLYTTFLRELPTDYEEAAVLDGAGPLRAFAHVVFPLVRPVTGTVVILNVVGIWNEFFIPLLYLAGSENTTAPVAIYSFVSQYVTVWPLVFAGLVISVVPILAVYFSLQKYVIRGFAGGLKG